ncbi:putative SnoaL-like aldol condensation-catalyzing enzyme [Pedobacter sp. UYP30]|uniref:nuclear transport factor 2 family protein n=1 Tax=Pedobacter sp. UYP30 TaxID=1756400 RepID=UPI0033988C0F
MTNQQLITEFYEIFYNEKNIIKAKEMMKENFINHHPHVPAGADSTIYAITNYVFNANPDFRVYIKKIISEGDFVWIYCFIKHNKNDKGSMAVDIWRIEDGKLAELWDVVQQIPDGINATSMF